MGEASKVEANESERAQKENQLDWEDHLVTTVRSTGLGSDVESGAET